MTGRRRLAEAAAALVGLALAALAFREPPSALGSALALAAVAAAALWIAAEDIGRLTIPDGATLLFGLAGLAAGRSPADGAASLSALATAAGEAAAAGGALWLLREAFYRRRGFDGLGLGDVKLAAAGAAAAGLFGLSLALLAASLAGLAVFAVLRLARRPVDRTTRLPFGALLAPALALAVLLERAGLLPLFGGAA